MNPIAELAGKTLVFGACVRPLVFSASRFSLDVAAADLFADWDTSQKCNAIRVAKYPAEFQHVVEKVRPCTAIYSGGLENYPNIIENIESMTNLAGNPARVLRSLMDPFAMSDYLRRCGFTVPALERTNPLSPADTSQKSIDPSLLATPSPRKASLFGKRWLRKKFRSCGGLDIQFWPNPNRLSDAAVAPENQPDHYFQEYWPGESISAMFVATAGPHRDNPAVFLGATRQLIGEADFCSSGFQYTGSIVCSLTPEEQRRATEMANRLVDQYHLKGIFNLDLVRTDSDLVFIEINPRIPSSAEVLERGYQFNALTLQIQSCRIAEDLQPLEWKQQSNQPPMIYGKAIQYAPESMTATQDFCQLVKSTMDDDGFASYADIPFPKTRIDIGQPVFTVFAKGKNEQEVRSLMRKKAALGLQCLGASVS